MNQCLEKFGMELLQSYYQEMTRDRFRVVSVGSGNGSIEHLIQNPRNPIICIDPDPDSFQCGGGINIKPHYAYCVDLVNAQPDIVGNCNLLLNWPEGDEEGRYDVDSILRLQPLHVLLLIDSTGGGGSDMFYEFLKQKVHGFLEVERDYGWVKPYVDYFDWSLLPRYYVVRSNVVQYETGNSFTSRNYRMLLLSTTKPHIAPVQICTCIQRCICKSGV